MNPGVLSDVDLIKMGENLVSPFNQARVQPSSYDLTLDGKFAIPTKNAVIDLRKDNPSDHMQFVTTKEIIVRPGDSLLGVTKEVVYCPTDLSARVEGKSSIGRLFLAIHVTAGVVDAGFRGQITLEIVNHGPWDIVLYEGMRIAQLSYFKMTTECATPYGSDKLKSHYLGQMGPTPSAGKRGSDY